MKKVVLLAAAFAAVSSSWASSVPMVVNTVVSSRDWVNYQILGYDDWDTAPPTGPVTINGSWLGSWYANPNGGSTSDAFLSFCLDVSNAMGNGSTQNYEARTFGEANTLNDNPNPDWVQNAGYRAAVLFNQHIGELSGVPGDSISNEQKVKHGAMALAIYELLYDTNFDVTSKTIKESGWSYGLSATAVTGTLGGEIIALANGWLKDGSVRNLDGPWPYEGTWWRNTGTGQSLIGAVPEPAEVILMIVATAGIGMGYRRLRTVRAEAA